MSNMSPAHTPANEIDDDIFGALTDIARIVGDIENMVPAGDWLPEETSSLRVPEVCPASQSASADRGRRGAWS